MKFFLFYDEFNSYLEIEILNKDKNFSEKYFNFCTSLNDFLNNFLYVNQRLHSEEHWIFFLKEKLKGTRLKTNLPKEREDLKVQFQNFNDLAFELKKLKIKLKKQISIQQSLLYQRYKYDNVVSANETRCNRNYNFIAESIKTTNRTHKQRLNNISTKLNSLEFKVDSLREIFFELRWLIVSSSRNLLRNHESNQLLNESYLNISVQTWETLISDVQEIIKNT